MAVLVASSNTNFFNRHIPDLEAAVTVFEEAHAVKKIAQLGAIFVKYNCYQDFGLMIVHRHFPLMEAEILVEAVNPEKSLSVSVPWRQVAGTQKQPTDPEYWNSFGFINKSYIVPKAWAFNPENPGQLEAFEFILSDDPTDAMSQKREFVEELYQFLSELGLDSIVGLRRLHGNRNSYETTPAGVRANVVKFGEVPQELAKDMIKVGWCFNEKGEVRGDQSCFACWCSHCDHCGSHQY